MLRSAFSIRLLAGLAATSMIASPVLAAATAPAPAPAQVNPAAVDPLVAMALLSTPQSRDALCAARSASAATDPALVAEAADKAGEGNGQAVVRGCVLPLNDAAALPATQTAALPQMALPSYAFGLPVLLAAAGVALLAAIKGFGDKGEGPGAGLSPA